MTPAVGATVTINHRYDGTRLDKERFIGCTGTVVRHSACTGLRYTVLVRFADGGGSWCAPWELDEQDQQLEAM